ncbi:MAG: hypothetical protein U1D00_25990, partial [Mycobacterium sp.]|nr:hypothetical protein [Mycobacterium sp.]
DAQRLGEALVNGRYFDETTPAEVLIAGRGRGREISFVGAEGAWEDPASVEYMRDLAEYIAPDIGGRPFTVVLLDEKLYEQRRCILADNWHCAPDR